MISNNLVVGIDVSKRFSYLAVKHSALPTCQKLVKVDHNKDGITKARDFLKQIEKEFGKAPTLVMESTGHYHELLFYSLLKSGYEVIVINPIQSNAITNLGVRKEKNDKKDAMKICDLYLLGRCKPSIIQKDARKLKELVRQRDYIIKQRSAFKNKLIAVLDRTWLGITDIFDDVIAATCLALLKQYPNPKSLLKASKPDVIKLLAQTSKQSLSWAMTKYGQLISLANDIEEYSLADEITDVTTLSNISVIECFNLQISKLEEVISSIGESEEYFKLDSSSVKEELALLRTIPGIGPVTANIILAETGSIDNFSKPYKLTAFAGLDPSTFQSGQFNGSKTRISKRGSRLLRQAYFQASCSLIAQCTKGNVIDQILYEYYLEKCKTKTKKQAIVALARKLVKITYAVLKKRQPYIMKTQEQHVKEFFSKLCA